MSQAHSISERALQIWTAGVEAVNSETLVRSAIQIRNKELSINGDSISLCGDENMLVTGAGKAGSGMAAGVEAAFKGSDSRKTNFWMGECSR